MLFELPQNNDWLDRLNSNLAEDPVRYLLRHPDDILVAEQLHAYPKARRKFPQWHREGILYTRLALEQSSGEEAARFKAGNIGGGELWDLTGGLGIDSYAFSRNFETVHYVESDPQPFQLARHNHKLWGCTNIRHHLEKAEEALAKIEGTDWIYLDPSRRDSRKRHFKLEDCQPDVTSMLPEMLKKSRGILLKLSPIYDLRQLLREIPQISKIQVVSVGGEVKEILAYIEPEPTRIIEAVVLPQEVRFSRPMETAKNIRLQNETTEVGTVSPQTAKWLFVPDAAIIKAEVVGEVGRKEGVFPLQSNTPYLVATEEIKVPGCTRYEIIVFLPFKPKMLKKELAGKRVNIHKRDFPLSPDELYKKLGLRMGDDVHLFFTKISGELTVIVTHAPVA